MLNKVHKRILIREINYKTDLFLYLEEFWEDEKMFIIK